MEEDPDDRLYECLTKTFAEQAKLIARRLREAADRIESESSPTGNAVVGSADYGRVDYMVAAKRILSTWLNLGPNAGIEHAFALAGAITEVDARRGSSSAPHDSPVSYLDDH